MKALTLLVVLLIVSCAPKQERKEKEVVKPTYYMPVKGKLKIHSSGFYIKSKCGSFVRAVEGGKVVYSGRDVGNYGWVVIVEQEDNFVSVYGKLERPWVKVGERVKRRQIIGKVGRLKKGCGIYYELRDRFGERAYPILR